MKTVDQYVKQVKQYFSKNAIMTDYVEGLTDDFIIEMILDVLIETQSSSSYLHQVGNRIIQMYEFQFYKANINNPFIATDVVNAIITSDKITEIGIQNNEASTSKKPQQKINMTVRVNPVDLE